MKRFFAIGGVALLLALVAWLVWGGDDDDDGGIRRPGSGRVEIGTPALRWSGGQPRGADGEASPHLTGAVLGRVLDAIGGSPIAGATVTLRSASGEALDETSSEEDGAFSFEETGDAEVVVAAAPGYAMHARTLVPGEIVLELDGAVTVAGVVVDPGGKPVRDAEVWVDDRERGYFRPPVVSSSVRTNAEGRFVIEDAPSGTLIAHAEHADFAEATVELGGVGPGRQKEGVRIELGDTGGLAGRVLDESGAPVAGALMTWISESRWWSDHDVVSRAGEDGRYRFPKLAPGRGLVRAISKGRDGAKETEIVVGAEATADIVVESLPHFTGTVVDSADRPVEGASVSAAMGWRGEENQTPLWRAQQRRGEESLGVTDAQGKFDFHAPATDGTAILYARTPTASGSETVEPDGGPVVIRLQGLGIARVHVVGGDGKPYLGDGRVSVESASTSGGRWGKSQALEKGTAVFEGGAGEWRIRVIVGDDGDDEDRDDDDEDEDDDEDDGPTPSLRQGEVKATIASAPPETDVTIRIAATLPATTSIRGRLVGGDGIGVAGARVSRLAEGREGGGSTGARLDWPGAVRSDPSGRFVIPLPSGTQKLFVYHPEYRSEIATVVVPAQGEGDAGVIHLDAGTGASAVYEFSGIGAVLAADDANRCVILDVIAGGPAERAGVRAKDILLEVDGVALHGMHLSDVIGRIRGPVGTTVTLRIERAGNLEPFLVDVVRDKIRA